MRSRPLNPSPLAPERGGLFLDNGSRVAVIGGGFAGSFFTYFLFEMAERIGMELAVDIYEPRDFTKAGPHELFLGERTIKTYFGSAMHMFLLNAYRTASGRATSASACTSSSPARSK